MSKKIILTAAFFSAMLAAAPVCIAGQQQEGAAEAARKAKAAKKTPDRPARVLTNDNLDSIKGAISVVGAEQAPAPSEQTASPAQPQAAAAGGENAAPAPPAVRDEAYWRKTFDAARKELADAEHELDILQREYNLKQQQYYSDPNTAMREQFTRQDLTDTKTKIDAKTIDVGKVKQKTVDLEDELRKSGGDPGWSRPPQQ